LNLELRWRDILEIRWGDILKNCLIPRKNRWFIRECLLLASILFDCFSTIVSCRAPYQEANKNARILMENYGIPLGSIMWSSVLALRFIIVLNLCSHYWNTTSKIYRILEIILDFGIAWYITGDHFKGAMSWFSTTPGLFQQIYGASFYLLGMIGFVVIPWVAKLMMRRKYMLVKS
jgi:hypothetical protein